MPNTNDIKNVLIQKFSESEIRVIDDSAKHAGHAGARPEGGTHFTVRIVSRQFAGLNRVARHRLVYAALEAHFAQGLHALAIETYTPEEKN